jgi:hypothetical protein
MNKLQFLCLVFHIEEPVVTRSEDFGQEFISGDATKHVHALGLLHFFARRKLVSLH